jgi:hypothetical protein
VKQSAPKRRSPLKRGEGPKRKPTATKRSGFTPASKAQREKVAGAMCIKCGDCDVFGGARIDPAHLCARGQGGCDDPLCVVPLCRQCHRAFDDGRLDVLPHLIYGHRLEIAHAVEHYQGDLIALLQRLTGSRYVPASEAA